MDFFNEIIYWIDTGILVNGIIYWTDIGILVYGIVCWSILNIWYLVFKWIDYPF